jgi:lipopolysaccharide/colanic/teichoic acid biosynthesis glycosyltransferase
MSAVDEISIAPHSAAVDAVESAQTPRDGLLYFPVKRCLDVAVAGVLVLVLAPFLLAIAAAIALETRGPVLFSQQRAGSRRRRKHGTTAWEPRSFRVLKFRTMIRDADPVLHEAHIRAFVEGRVAAENGGGATFKLHSDPRVTRVGRVLRKTSIDELPQLFNVLVGHMSLVGPRPVPLYEAALYGPSERERLCALPGITGLWQVSGRCELPFEEMIRLDVEYVRRRSLWLDLSILARTLPAIVSGRGAG